MQRSEDERLLAMIAHASAVMNAVNLLGVLITVLILITQREKSRYVRAHALQSLVYQGVIFLVVLLLMLTWSICLGSSILPMLVRPELYQDGGLPLPFWLALLSGIAPLGLGVMATIYALYGAIQVYLGAPFRYPLVGRLIAADLLAGAASELPPSAGKPAKAVPAPEPAQVVAEAPAETQPDPAPAAETPGEPKA